MTNIGRIRALVTGASGFVGSRLAHRLVGMNWDVHVVVRPTTELDKLAVIKRSIATYMHGGSTEHLTSILASAKPDVVFHVASHFCADHQSGDVIKLIQANVQFGAQLLEAMAANGVRRIVNTGTSWQHYNNQSYSPVCLYASTKQAFEAILQYYVEACDFHAITLKLFDTYGPNDTRLKLFHWLRQVAESGEILPMSQGEQLIDLVHIDDVVEAYLVAAKRLLDGTVASAEAYAVSSGVQLTLKELTEQFEFVIGKKLAIQWGGRPYRHREVMDPWSNGKSLPGWTPTVKLKDGLKQLVLYGYR